MLLFLRIEFGLIIWEAFAPKKSIVLRCKICRRYGHAISAWIVSIIGQAESVLEDYLSQLAGNKF